MGASDFAMTADPTKTEIQIDCDHWLVLDCAVIAARCFTAIEAVEQNVKWPVVVLFTDDAAIAALNLNYRGKDSATNVLSFPPGDALTPEFDYLGDMAVAFETCRKEAEEKNISLHDHAAHLLVHGMLHLIGYDHEHDDDAKKMERREVEILASLDIANPYADTMETME